MTARRSLTFDGKAQYLMRPAKTLHFVLVALPVEGRDTFTPFTEQESLS